MARIPIEIEVPRDLDRPIVDVITPELTVADRRERFVTQVKLQNSRLRAYVGNDPHPHACHYCESLMLASDGKTIDGKWEFDVGTSLCYDVPAFGEPSILASPVRIDQPVIASVGYFLSEDSRQLVLRVFTATANGEPINAYFHWQALIPCEPGELI